VANALLEALHRAAMQPGPAIFNKAVRLDSAVSWANFSGASSYSGKRVNVDKALRVSAVWACARLIAETLATLPFGIYKRLPNNGREVDTGHPLHNIFAVSPNNSMSSYEFIEFIAVSLVLAGNMYGYKHFSGKTIVAIDPLLPQNMRLEFEGNRVRYFYRPDKGAEKELNPDEVLHIKAFSLDGRVGLSPIQYGANAIGSAMAADEAAGTTFKNGMMPTTAFKVDRTLKPDQRDEFRSYVETVSGAMNAGKSPVLESGVSVEKIGISPADAQLLETRGWGVEEICRIFRVFPWMIGHTEKSTSWGTGLEQQMIAFLTLCLAPWARRIEKAIHKQLMLPGERGTHYGEFTLEGLLRADSKARAEFYDKMTRCGILSRDDCREKENLPRLGGNASELTVEANLVLLEKLSATDQGNAVRAALRAWLNESSFISDQE